MAKHCQHSDCEGELRREAPDPLLPDYVVLYTCMECGEVWENDTQDGSMSVS